MEVKIDNIMARTVKAESKNALKAMVAFDPSHLQTAKMVSRAVMQEAIPAVNLEGSGYFFFEGGSAEHRK